ncbi:type II restriction endonuclease [Psychrobacter sp. BI730]|uniref:type II restriction endonuclease n=1 Tax=Psychrobacter sp. BI730 TaxID=2705463 RepID=UPI0015CA3A50|nr:type II restriction endonuclease [Psychrobacter sp. BI730]NYR10854.1 type II deoxyribonuclease [Psychrobacter sp. BI730]
MNELYQAEHFTQLVETLSQKGILQYDYFVNWAKVLTKIEPIEKELNILNAAVGKEDIEGALLDIFKEYPKTVKAIPALLAIRDKSIDILIDKTNYIHRNFDFKHRKFTNDDLNSLVDFVMQSGLGKMMQDRNIRNLPDYCTGVEVGLDSNARKNRGGTQMEQLVESFVALFCHENDLEYLPQGSVKSIKETWGVDVKIGKAGKNIDFVIYKKSTGTLYFIECNFYNGNGSKLKSTASEYTKMSELWKEQGIEFIWVTDGKGWYSSIKALRDYFDYENYLLNIDMLQKGYLERIIL